MTRKSSQLHPSTATIIPKRLPASGHIRILAPSKSFNTLEAERVKLCQNELSRMGFRVSFGANLGESDYLGSSSVKARVADIHEAFLDKSVDAVLAAMGGYVCNQILEYLDYELIAANPKILCGYSDITALTLAVFAKTGLMTYCGPNYASFGRRNTFDETAHYFMTCLCSSIPFEFSPPHAWVADWWEISSEKIKLNREVGYKVINPGQAEGTSIGGNLSTLNLLHGTGYMPKLADSILFIEDDHEVNLVRFARDLQSLLQQQGAKDIRALVIGRFQPESNIKLDQLTKLLLTHLVLSQIPIVADVDFGHTNPIYTFPIGGLCTLSAKGDKVMIRFDTH